MFGLLAVAAIIYHGYRRHVVLSQCCRLQLWVAQFRQQLPSPHDLLADEMNHRLHLTTTQEISGVGSDVQSASGVQLLVLTMSPLKGHLVYLA